MKQPNNVKTFSRISLGEHGHIRRDVIGRVCLDDIYFSFMSITTAGMFKTPSKWVVTKKANTLAKRIRKSFSSSLNPIVFSCDPMKHEYPLIYAMEELALTYAYWLSPPMRWLVENSLNDVRKIEIDKYERSSIELKQRLYTHDTSVTSDIHVNLNDNGYVNDNERAYLGNRVYTFEELYAEISSPDHEYTLSELYELLVKFGIYEPKVDKLGNKTYLPAQHICMYEPKYVILHKTGGKTEHGVPIVKLLYTCELISWITKEYIPPISIMH
jgi:hypothetical protein